MSGPLDEPERARTFILGDDGKVAKVVDGVPPVADFRPLGFRWGDRDQAMPLHPAEARWIELGRLLGAPEDITDSGALLELAKDRLRPKRTLLLRWTDDEVCETYLDGVGLMTVTFDDLGWSGMRSALDGLRELARRLGATVAVEGTPGI